MAYQALYRKYRPQTFDDVIGQEHIVRTLKNQIMTGRVSHAYLFCGTRGTGKTTTAKIFAKAINCLAPLEANPCNQCEMCRAINEGRSVNAIEIDAASNNGVDNIREIREEVKYPPTEGHFKVYIIDEVHMLTTEAFNALLKTLEEPPEHVIFILATTDPQKVLPTIHSRCQRFDFRRISVREIAAALKKYLALEGVSATDEALEYVAAVGDGSMRDSLSILDQCIAFYFNEQITLEKVLETVGAVDKSVLFDLSEAIIDKNAQKAMEVIEQAVELGRELGQFAADFLEHLRNLLVVKTAGETNIIEASPEYIKRLTKAAQNVSNEELMYYIRSFSQLLNEMRYAANRRILFEVCVIKLCSPVKEVGIDGLYAKVAELERKLESGSFAVIKEEKKNSAISNTAVKEKSKPKPKAASADIIKAIDIWDEVKTEFDAATNAVLGAVSIGHMEDERLYFICDNEATLRLAENKLDAIKLRLETTVGKEFNYKFILRSEYDAWEKGRSGNDGDNDDDPEFEALMNSYIPDVEIE